jgi:phage gp46-like protein
MDFQIEMASGLGKMTFEKAGDMNLLNNIFLSLMVPRGGFFARPEFGSRLHELLRMKNNPASADLARDYCQEALQWLIDCGKVTSFDISVERVPDENPHRLKVQVVATKADLSQVIIETYQEVE